MYDDETAMELFLEAKQNYQDRGMIKWIGFYLSDHTALLTKDNKQRYKENLQKPQQTLEEISQLLQQSYIQNKRIALQLEALDSERKYYDDLIGRVIGQKDQLIYLATDEEEIVHLEIEQLRHAELLGPNKILTKDESNA
ncbi:hypothetical protein [Enterococcus pallens]|uniref:Uncharacterized protein n=1 Tax=Enterococcus pallens ATCC BAA-351 TaxID=1158607 RepID=R2S8E8_9ENTE|nr:hypothetical protein [Enterococcus pallens]EOH91825.1 hypothetical protein UAU_03127 [Enterococcus pallens ATCC BAA-351]EOU25253.1 hypothetical protein I588_01241 [Enterococcus pallens ATCC BAA-351]OJG79946.1 hypothetical protein RV10_GL005016 [Enterococcus pallens]